jgi:hypothetical protein
MGSESELVLGLWETFKDVIPAGKREDTANKMLKILEDWVDLEEVAPHIQGEDTYLDRALSYYIEPTEDEDEFEDE